MRVHVCPCISVWVSIRWNVQVSVYIREPVSCVTRYACVLMCVHEGADTDGKGWCQGQGQTWETLFTKERWTGRWESEWGGEKEKREKKREIQGEVLLSLTTKVGVRQGQTVRDHLTVASCTSHGPLKIIQTSSLTCRATTYTTAHLGKILTVCYDPKPQGAIE